MDTRRSAVESAGPVAWPLTGSLILTGIVVAFLCVPPFTGLHSWWQVFWLACLYMVTAACVHALAVWSIFRIQSENVREWTRVWPVVWGAWIAVVWLPLLAVLTYERSAWVALIVPVAALFLKMFLVSRRTDDQLERTYESEAAAAAQMFALGESPRLWRTLLPALAVAIAVDAGIAAFALGHAWRAGALFAVATAYLTGQLLSRTAAPVKVQEDSVRRGAAGNSVAVWMLTVVALLPFLAGMAAGIRGLMGMPAVQAAKHASGAPHLSWGYSGIILTLPRRPHQIVTPLLTAHADGIAKSRLIPFDGTYWYFKRPDTRPEPNAQVVAGNPLKGQIRSTDSIPLEMEAHQRLGQEMNLSCCRALELHVVNADATPGAITMEVLLRDSHAKADSGVSLGSKVLASSTVSPMPLHRAPVPETLTFQIPRTAKRKSFDEITVQIRPERFRSLAGPHVAIEGFMFEP